mmetsp:Transcript_40744/g.125982  ORF Transcript_40744/g.125982 Transcript_40744/m.125982 type:complete len:363 (-) Transcript_40744:759-1847(-)
MALSLLLDLARSACAAANSSRSSLAAYFSALYLAFILETSSCATRSSSDRRSTSVAAAALAPGWPPSRAAAAAAAQASPSLLAELEASAACRHCSRCSNASPESHSGASDPGPRAPPASAGPPTGRMRSAFMRISASGGVASGSTATMARSRSRGAPGAESRAAAVSASAAASWSRCNSAVSASARARPTSSSSSWAAALGPVTAMALGELRRRVVLAMWLPRSAMLCKCTSGYCKRRSSSVAEPSSSSEIVGPSDLVVPSSSHRSMCCSRSIMMSWSWEEWSRSATRFCIFFFSSARMLSQSFPNHLQSCSCSFSRRSAKEARLVMSKVPDSRCCRSNSNSCPRKTSSSLRNCSSMPFSFT